MLAGLRTRSGASDFTPQESLQVVALAVIGGAGSPFGAVLGAVFVLGVPAVFGDTTVAGLLPTGLGLLVLVLLFPGGFWEVGQWLRDRFRPRPPTVPAAVQREPVAPRTPSGLVVSGLTVRFGGRVALDHVDLAVEPGQVLGLIGANGAGKSTLLDVVNGFLYPDEGSVALDGRSLLGLPVAGRATAGVGRVLQDARLFDNLTLREAVLAAAPGPAGRRAGPAGEALALLGLERFADVECQRLSTGTRRLGELACAIVGRPSILLLDEPTAGLAQREAEAFGPFLARLQESLGVSVVLVEHDVPLVMSVADRLVCLGAGLVLAAGAPAEVVAHPDVVASFLGTDPTAVKRSGL
jgi:ABC-type branched-subunit amino acid transport system ATPase component